MSYYYVRAEFDLIVILLCRIIYCFSNKIYGERGALKKRNKNGLQRPPIEVRSRFKG